MPGYMIHSRHYSGEKLMKSFTIVSSPEADDPGVSSRQVQQEDMNRGGSGIPEPPPLPNQTGTGPGQPNHMGGSGPPPLPPPPPECRGSSRQGSTTSEAEGRIGGDETCPALPPKEAGRKDSNAIPLPLKHFQQESLARHRPGGGGGAGGGSGGNKTVHVLSSLYAKLLVVASVVLVATELLHNPIPLLFFHGYLYTYLLGGAVICLMSIYICVMVDRCPTITGDLERGRTKRTLYLNPDISIFLRTGMLVFGLGCLIGCGLEIATVFTLTKPCTDEVNMAQPILLAIFTFLQMHFLFLNSQVCQQAIRSLGCFRHLALMHLVAANLGVWLRILLWDTTTEWIQASHIQYNETQRWPPKNYSVTAHAVNFDGKHTVFHTSNCLWKTQENSLEDFLILKHCLKNSTIGVIWEMAQHFLSPFSVQYSLMAAAILYVFWESNGEGRHWRKAAAQVYGQDSSSEAGAGLKSGNEVTKKTTSKIDCRGSSKGLFLGLLVLVAGLIIMILFFVLNKDHDLHFDTLFAVLTMHCSVMGTATFAILIGLCQAHRLRFRHTRGRRLSDLVQGLAVLPVYALGIVGMVVGGMDVTETKHMVLFVDGALMILHACFQSLFIRQMVEKSYVPASSHSRSRPGRQAVMYLIFCNSVLWLVESFTAQKHIASQLQLGFYGPLSWGVFSRVAMPLMVLYRFHSAVVLMDIWRKTYRLKSN